MSDYQVTCHKPDNSDADLRIQGLGGAFGYKGIDTLIREIEGRINSYWTTTADRKTVRVIVAKRNNGRKYLKTEADGVEPNNLLALPKCP